VSGEKEKKKSCYLAEKNLRYCKFSLEFDFRRFYVCKDLKSRAPVAVITVISSCALHGVIDLYQFFPRFEVTREPVFSSAYQLLDLLCNLAVLAAD
jgi:hypothetical protein